MIGKDVAICSDPSLVTFHRQVTPLAFLPQSILQINYTNQLFPPVLALFFSWVFPPLFPNTFSLLYLSTFYYYNKI